MSQKPAILMSAHLGTKRFGASTVVRASYEHRARQGQPSNRIFAGSLPTDWETAGP